MKKLFLLIAIVGAAVCSYATTQPKESWNDSYTQTSVQIYYDGPAYSAVSSNGLIPNAGDSIDVYWTDNGCSVNGNFGYQVTPITDGGYPIRVNGRLKYMTHFVSYKGERYFFQR